DLPSSFRHVVCDHAFPFPLGFEDVLDSVAGGAISTAMRRDPVGLSFNFWTRVLYSDGQAAFAHHWQVDDVITNESGFRRVDPVFLQDLLEDSGFILNALMDVIDFEIACAEGDCFRPALGDEPSSYTGEPGQRDGSTVMRVKALGFYEGRALKTETTFSLL